jgi:hypothetical protein
VQFDEIRARGLSATNHIHWWAQTNQGGFSLLALLRTIRSHDAGDDKDKIYSILNIVDYNLSATVKPFNTSAGKVRDITGPLRPDCGKGKSAMDVYRDVACYIMTQEKSLDLLTFGDRTP